MLEPAYDIDPILNHADPSMMEADRKRRALAPGIGGGVVLLDDSRDEGEASSKAPYHVNLALYRGGHHLGPFGQGRRLRDPLPLALGECEAGYGNQDRGDEDTKGRSP